MRTDVQPADLALNVCAACILSCDRDGLVLAFVDAVTGLVGGDIKEALERQLWTIERTDASYLEAPYRTTHAPSARRTHMPRPFDRWSRRDLCERGSFSLNGRGA